MLKKCEHIKDMILTDYIDGQLDQHSSAGIENHLLGCADCRAFLQEVKRHALLPSKQQLNVPVELWGLVKQGIEENQLNSNPFENFIRGLKGLLVLPKMIPAFVSLAVIFLIGTISLNTMQFHQAQAKEQGEYLISLLSPTSASSAMPSNDLGTPIEHYFL